MREVPPAGLPALPSTGPSPLSCCRLSQRLVLSAFYKTPSCAQIFSLCFSDIRSPSLICFRVDVFVYVFTKPLGICIQFFCL
ncbi:hypothetical protein SUGI_0333510 [Cryptomeria japonica]|nr:hypothetical protein SUGI_0333510 [Cryptomeria japonica]